MHNPHCAETVHRPCLQKYTKCFSQSPALINNLPLLVKDALTVVASILALCLSEKHGPDLKWKISARPLALALEPSFRSIFRSDDGSLLGLLFSTLDREPLLEASFQRWRLTEHEILSDFKMSDFDKVVQGWFVLSSSQVMGRFFSFCFCILLSG